MRALTVDELGRVLSSGASDGAVVLWLRIWSSTTAPGDAERLAFLGGVGVRTAERARAEWLRVGLAHYARSFYRRASLELDVPDLDRPAKNGARPAGRAGARKPPKAADPPAAAARRRR